MRLKLSIPSNWIIGGTLRATMTGFVAIIPALGLVALSPCAAAQTAEAAGKGDKKKATAPVLVYEASDPGSAPRVVYSEPPSKTPDAPLVHVVKDPETGATVVTEHSVIVEPAARKKKKPTDD